MTVTKQAMGALGKLRRFIQESPRWDYVRPNAFLDTRIMGMELYPEAFGETMGESSSTFIEMAAEKVGWILTC